MDKVRYCILCGSAVDYQIGWFREKTAECPMCHAVLHAKKSFKKTRIWTKPSPETREIVAKIMEARVEA